MSRQERDGDCTVHLWKLYHKEAEFSEWSSFFPGMGELFALSPHSSWEGTKEMKVGGEKPGVEADKLLEY